MSAPVGLCRLHPRPGLGRDALDERGVVLVEFTLMLPVVVLFFLASIDLGRYGAVIPVIRHGAAVGARTAATTRGAIASQIGPGGAFFDTGSLSSLSELDGAAVPVLNKVLRYAYVRQAATQYDPPAVTVTESGSLVTVRIEYLFETSSVFGYKTYTLVGESTARREIQ